MSVGELVALVRGLFDSRSSVRMADTPDNTCCFCLTLQSGTILIGTANSVFYLSMFTWYLTSSLIEPGGLREGLAITSMDLSIFSIVTVQILVNILLLVGTIKKRPCHTLPWLCANAVALMIAIVCIVVTILFGTTKLSLNYSEYVTTLTILGMFTAINLFCWIVVFTFRKNLMMESQMGRHCLTPDDPSSNHLPFTQTPNAPPPTYYETEGFKDCKPPPEEAPPQYEEAISMLAKESKDHIVAGAVLRKKSLTNNEL